MDLFFRVESLFLLLVANVFNIDNEEFNKLASLLGVGDATEGKTAVSEAKAKTSKGVF